MKRITAAIVLAVGILMTLVGLIGWLQLMLVGVTATVLGGIAMILLDNQDNRNFNKEVEKSEKGRQLNIELFDKNHILTEKYNDLALKNSTLNREKEEFLKEIEKLRLTIQHMNEDANLDNAYSFEAGHDACLSKLKQISVDFYPDADYTKEPLKSILHDWDGETPFCRIGYYADNGDPSVGMPGYDGWGLAEDQSGTLLELLLSAQKEEGNVIQDKDN